MPAKPGSIPPQLSQTPARASVPAAGRAFDDLDLAAGPALELDHAPIGRPSQPSAESTGPRRAISATFRSPVSGSIPAQRPPSSGAIPAARPPGESPLPAPPAPPSLPPPPVPGSSVPPVEARRSTAGSVDAPAVKQGLFAFIPPRARIPVGVGLVLIAVIIAIRVLVKPRPAVDDGTLTSQPTTVPVAHEDHVDLVSVEVVGLPQGAVVRLDGLPSGTMPMRVRQGTHHVLIVTAPGYVQRTIELTATGDLHIPADMRPLIGTQ